MYFNVGIIFLIVLLILLVFEGMSDGGQDSYLAWISECCYDAFIAIFIDDCCWEISMAVTKSVDSPPACLQFLYHLGQDS